MKICCNLKWYLLCFGCHVYFLERNQRGTGCPKESGKCLLGLFIDGMWCIKECIWRCQTSQNLVVCWFSHDIYNIWEIVWLFETKHRAYKYKL